MSDSATRGLTVAHHAPPSMGFSRQEYWSGLPFPSPGDPADPGIEPRSPALQADALTSEPPGKTHSVTLTYLAIGVPSDRASQVVLVVKNISANARDTGSIPGWGRPLEEAMATHSSILAWRIPWTEEHGRLQSMGSHTELDTTE